MSTSCTRLIPLLRRSQHHAPISRRRCFHDGAAVAPCWDSNASGWSAAATVIALGGAFGSVLLLRTTEEKEDTTMIMEQQQLQQENRTLSHPSSSLLLQPPRPMSTMSTMAFAATVLDVDETAAAYTEYEPTNKAQHKQPVKQRSEPFDVSARAIKGGRVTMEDEFFVADGGRFAAVFDGHGGGGVSQFLKRNLYPTVAKHLLTQENNSVFSHVAAVKSAFTEIDQAVLNDDCLGYQGSTAVAVLLHENEQGHRTLLSANVGDSRAVLSRNHKAIELTRDHKPNEEREKERILAMGETIEWDRFSKVHRVRNLSLSRAIGDSYAKPAVSGQVEIKHWPITEEGDEFVLLASDGLWDVMSSEEAVQYVHRRMETELSRDNIRMTDNNKDDRENYQRVLRRNMAKSVAREALRRGSSDNICVVLVWLQGTAGSS